MNTPCRPPEHSVFVTAGELLGDVFRKAEVRAALRSELQTYLNQTSPLHATRARDRLQELAVQPQLTPAEADEAFRNVRVTELAVHEAAHLAGTYLFQTRDETRVRTLLLPGHPELNGELCAVTRQEISTGVHSAVSMILPVMCPEVTHTDFHFTASGRTYGQSEPLSRADHAVVNTMLRSVQVNADGPQHDDVALSRTVMQRHRDLIRACAHEMAAPIVEAMWDGQHAISADPLLRRLRPLATRGQHSAASPTVNPWWSGRWPWQRSAR